MAESLGEAVLRVRVDDGQFKAGLSSLESQTRSTFSKINKDSQFKAGTGGVGRQTSITAQGIKPSIDGAQFKAGFDGLENQARVSVGGINAVLGTIGVGLSLAAVVGGFKGLVGSAIELESITKRLNNTLGAQGTTAALNFTKGLANDLGLNFKTLAGTFASFTGAASAAGVPLEQQKAVFAAVSKAGQALGLSNEEISGSFLALSQVASKGTVSMEELRGQLGERLPIALAATAKGLGVSQAELIKLVSSGQLSADRFFPALTAGLNELTVASGGTLTTAQNLEKLRSSWDQLMTGFGQNILPGVTATVVTLTNAIDGLGVRLRSLDLNRSFGIDVGTGDGLVGQLSTLEQRNNLTPVESKNLLSDSLAAAGVEKGPFGGAIISAKQYAFIQQDIIDRAIAFRQRNKDNNAELKEQEIIAARIARGQLETEKVNKNVVAPAQLNLDNARALVGLSGQALETEKQAQAVAAERLKIDEARANFIKVGGDAAVGAGDPLAIQAKGALDAAGLNLQRVLVEGSARAAENLRTATLALEAAFLSNNVKEQVIGKEGLQRSTIEGSGQLAQSGLELRNAINEGLTGPALLTFGEKLRGAALSFKDTLTSGIKQATQALEDAKTGLLNLRLDNSRFQTPQEQARNDAQLNADFQRAQQASGRNVNITGDKSFVQSEQRAFIDFVKNEGRGKENVNNLETGLAAANDALAATNTVLSGNITSLAGLIPGLTEALAAIGQRDNNITVLLNAGETASVPTGIN